jgi:prophage regulatory protein
MQTATINSPVTILRARQVREKTGLSRSTIYLKIQKGEFPAGVSLGDRAVGWLSNDIEGWITSRAPASRPSANQGTVKV